MNEPVKDSALDRVLTAEKEIVPSSGFIASVMAKVRHEAAMKDLISVPPSTPFPWAVALAVPLIGLLSAGGMMAGISSRAMGTVPHEAQRVVLSTAASSAMKLESLAVEQAINLPNLLMQVEQQAIKMGVGWLLAALFLSYITIELSMLSVGNRS